MHSKGARTLPPSFASFTHCIAFKNAHIWVTVGERDTILHTPTEISCTPLVPLYKHSSSSGLVGLLTLALLLRLFFFFVL